MNRCQNIDPPYGNMVLYSHVLYYSRGELLQTRFKKLSTKLFSSGEVKEICNIVEKKLTQDTKLLQSCESHKNVIEGFLDGTCQAQRLLLVTGLFLKPGPGPWSKP